MAVEPVYGVHTVDSWTQHLNNAKESKQLVAVDFTATWCGPCRIISPIFSELAKKFTNVIFLKVDVDELRSVAEEWSVEAMPTFIFLKEGKLVHKIVGARKEELVQTVEKLATETAAA
ncbi:hypothetical protein HS088_TW11G00884 [Tripterygium wilfordii]|uniref:Thioredoxin domain-containing protein n=1 Tax=Tripterygium wilfordii TaxID=458696 RepID=A0A7J7D373_TRIWF|nr:thioredoxin H-type 2-like [Tripterygium wilfordii]KAF5740804.1 hypothetical protein HS088_TW11G00884 [Tripterygium wilfordii]